MARQLRFTGTDSKVDGCPARHTDESTGEIIVQGTPVTDPEDLAQLPRAAPRGRRTPGRATRFDAPLDVSRSQSGSATVRSTSTS